jgi:shikimate kinase
MMRHVVILGLMGVGKTTVGELLAHRLGWPVRDSDRDIEARTGRTGRQIASEDGVDVLHQLETDVFLDAVAAPEPAVVLAAGYVVESVPCREAIEQRTTAVWLELPLPEVLIRMHTGHHRRDVSEAELQDQAHRREPLFRQLADIVVDARHRPDTIVDEVLAGLGRLGRN